MTPGGRAAAAIDILDQIIATRTPADRLANDYFRSRRYIGSKDRTAVQAIVYGCLRHRAQLEWWLARVRDGARREPFAPNGRAWAIAYLAILQKIPPDKIASTFSGEQYDPPPLSRGELAAVEALSGRSIEHPEQGEAVRANIPAWIVERFRQRFGDDHAREMAAFTEEAPLDMRANILKTDRRKLRGLLAGIGIETEPTRLSPWGLRAATRSALMASAPYKDGLVEVQDEGSQLVALLAAAEPGMRVCDFCAGAGGKTLAIAATMGNKGQIAACDVSAKRLEATGQRLRRAGVFNVERTTLADERDNWVKKHKGFYDRVLVDAPCTGTGTWRRNPDARWTLREPEIAELADKQHRILDSAARLVKPGGRLIYATCSLLADENEVQADAFAAAHPEFMPVPVPDIWAKVATVPCPTAGPYLTLNPARDRTDGFFVAVFERKADALAPAAEGG
ncbi:MAG: RsmB/NOP family class I SAM-dependent RNA methyltransferase [Proteobacteria bacterium]|nr:RsmB/NOP family class I SAM-dependent RNA methyltransferase [Pseudomonadota bacterium]